MYNILFGIQILAVLLTFACVVLLLVQKNSGIAKFMMLACICTFIQNTGYLMEMRSANLSEAMMAVRFEYLGTSFILTATMVFVFKYCKIELFSFAKWALLIIDIAVLLCVWCYEYTPLYYSGVDFANSGVLPHLILVKGPLYIIFVVVMYLEFLASIVVSIVSIIRTNDSNMKSNYIVLALACTLPLFFHISGAVNLIDGHDPAPLGGAVGTLIFVGGIAFRHMFDIVEMAHESILMELDEAVIILDYRHGFQEANDKAYVLFPELRDINPGEAINDKILKRVIENSVERDIVIGSNTYDAKLKEVYSNKILVGHTIVLVDITDSKLQLDKMTELREAADSANQAKSSFLASVSHEIRTPINVVVGMSDVILRDYSDEKLLGYAENIQEAAKSLLDLINDILDFSKIESGKTTLSNFDYQTNRFFYDLVNTYEHRGDENGVKFEKNIATNIPAVLYGDETRIRQIMTNILTNAFKYTREGSVLLRAAFEWINDDTGNLILSVEDTGIGIQKTDLDKLFEVFVRLDERINRSVEGTGLGLNITKQLLELMGGEIKVYSEYGKGSVFTVIIPQAVHCDVNQHMGEINLESHAVSKRKKVDYIAPNAEVLVVDDSKTNLIVAKALLRDTQVKVTTATSGAECIELVKQKRFDVIFLDHRMPEMDGVETLHRMRGMLHKSENAPVIMLTANAVSDAKEYYIGEGFTDFISKPISEETITGMLANYLPEDMIERG